MAKNISNFNHALFEHYCSFHIQFTHLDCFFKKLGYIDGHIAEMNSVIFAPWSGVGGWDFLLCTVFPGSGILLNKNRINCCTQVRQYSAEILPSGPDPIA